MGDFVVVVDLNLFVLHFTETDQQGRSLRGEDWTCRTPRGRADGQTDARPTSCPGLAGAASREGPIAEAGEALPPSRRPHVAVVTVDQDLPEGLPLDSKRITKS